MNNFFEIYEKARLKPNHEISQWYMCMEDMQKQVEYLTDTINHEKILFLGDGDGVSILLALMSYQRQDSKIKEICVFDIDERELNLYKKLASKYKIGKKIKFSVVHYNVFDIIPQEYKNYFDFFYINPPYSYTTNPVGLGFALWLERCIELTKENCEGCIVYPIEHGDIDVSKVYKFISSFLKEKFFTIISHPSITHRYNESECISKNVLVKKTSKTVPKYNNREFPKKLLKSLYHYSNNPPHYITDDGSDYGKKIDF